MTTPPYFDEAYEPGGEPRPHYRAVLEALHNHDLGELGRQLRARVLEREVRYGSTGPDAFVIDAVPRMFTREEWETLDRGLAQRVRALDAFLRDAYGERRIVEAGIVPDRLIGDGAFYEPDMQGVEVPVWVGFAGLDVVRGADGEFNVLEDNVRMPTGLGFAPLAWEAAGDLIDGLPERSPAPGESTERFASILRSAAPDGRGDPSIVVLGDGFENDAQWEISDVAFRLGVPMVGLDDLRRREGRVYAHVDGRRREVDVIYRRSNYHLLRDEDGSPSALADKLLEPIRRGTVTVVNPPGVGIADDKLAHAYVEDMIRFYLEEEPVIAPARSYDLADADAREDALGRLGEMVVKVRDRVGGEGVLIGPEAEGAREDIERRPQDFIAQELVELSRHPTLFDGELSPRRIDLRPLIAYDGGEHATVLGGLTRVALGEDSKVVNMAQGGGVKATWTAL
ncbi:MAG: circularly permuted type 2 ATP-grasp protein [Solirubrobacteraceae bacterium]